MQCNEMKPARYKFHSFGRGNVQNRHDEGNDNDGDD